MTQKTKARIALTAFLAACLIPSAGMLLLPQGEAAANQTLAPAPRLFLEDGSFNTQVLDEVTDYVADHFAFRQEMITAGAALDAAVFSTCPRRRMWCWDGRTGSFIGRPWTTICTPPH